MFRTALILIVLVLLLTGATAHTERQDYTDQLMKPALLTGNKQYREAINDYKNLEARPGTPAWLKAGCEYEIADLYGTMNETDNAVTALSRAVQLGFDDCISPRASEHLTAALKTPKGAQALAAMKITEADFRELVWLKAEVDQAEHDTRMMIIANMNRVDQQATEVPQAQLPARHTASAGVLYWRQLLLLMQKVQKEFVQRSDLERIKHAATMGMINGGASQSAVLESAQRARVAAEARKAEIRRRAFVPVTTTSDQPKPCSEWS